MEVLQFSFGAVGPIILLIALGLFLRRKMVGEADIQTMTRLVFNIFLPVMAFNNIAAVDFSAEFNGRLMLFTVVSLVGLIGVLWFGLRPLVRDRGLHAAVVHILFRSNFLILGTALMGNMYGDEGTRIASMLIPLTILPFNLFAVLVLSAARVDNRQSPAQIAREIVLGIVKNPLIIGCVLGTLYALSGPRFPAVLESALRSTGSIASPLSIILVGCQLDFSTLRSNARALVWTSLARLVLVPLAMVALCVAFGFRGIELSVLFVLYASPCATSVAIMTRIYNVQPVFSAQMVVISNGFCCFTLFFGLSLLRALGLI